ncbi:MAG: hypothetical protein Q4Q07_09150 [Tissierellia bacterium]|nr:hypothetical protein [Tissierellia bacterium]
MKKLISLLLIIGLLIGCSGGNGNKDVEEEEQGYKFNIFLDKEVLSKIEENMEEIDVSWEFEDWTISLEKAFWRNNILFYQLVSKYQGKDTEMAEMNPFITTEFYENGEVVNATLYGSVDSYEDGVRVYNGEANFEDRDWEEDFPFTLGLKEVVYVAEGENPGDAENKFEDTEGKALSLKNQNEAFPEKRLKVEGFSFENSGYTITIDEIILDSIYTSANGTMTEGQDHFPRIMLTNGEDILELMQLGWPTDEGKITFRGPGILGIENWEEVKGEILIPTQEELQEIKEYDGSGAAALQISPIE